MSNCINCDKKSYVGFKQCLDCIKSENGGQHPRGVINPCQFCTEGKLSHGFKIGNKAICNECAQNLSNISNIQNVIIDLFEKGDEDITLANLQILLMGKPQYEHITNFMSKNPELIDELIIDLHIWCTDTST